MLAIFQLSLHQLAGPWRLLLTGLLAVLPVLLTVVIGAVSENDDPAGFVEFLIDGMLIAAILPIVIMALATAAFGNEVEDKTLSYLVLKPIPRWRIVLPKLLAVLLIGGSMLVVSGVGATLIGPAGGIRAAVSVGTGLLAGSIAYSAIFTWAGLVTTRALGFALVYVFLWEGLLSTFLGGVRYLSVRGYTQGIMYAIDEDALEALGSKAIQFPAAVGGVVAVTAVFSWLTVRRLRRMDVP